MDYTSFSDSTPAIERAVTDRAGPGQALARAIIELEELLVSVTTRWTPAYKGVEGNEVADSYAKWAAESHHDPVERTYLQEASLAHFVRKTTEARSQCTREWIRSHVKSGWRHSPPMSGRILQDLRKERKEIAIRYFQLLSGHAVIGPHLAERAKTIRSSECWWCGSGE